MGKLKIASIFTGCGGMDLGIQGGFNFLDKRYSKQSVEIVFANDIEKSACEIFGKNFNCKIENKDIKKIPSSEIPDHDILIAGFPCQPFSIVAQNPPRIGIESEIGQLFFELVRILKDKKPSCFIAENVKGILSANGGKAFDLIIKELENAGYVLNYQVINSQNFGVPQKRERVFIVGFKKELGLKPEIHEPTENIIPLKKILEKENSIEKKYYFSERAVEGLKRANPRMNKGRNQNIDHPCSTVGSHLAKVSLNSTDPVLKENGKYRRFTPREVARIQSFPENFVLTNFEGKQYRALGNAVPPVVMWHISKKIIHQLKVKMNQNVILVNTK